MDKKLSKLLLVVILVVSMIISNLVSAVAAPSDLVRANVYTYAEGNIARHPEVVQSIPTGSAAASINRTYNSNGNTVGITASYTSSSNGANDRFFPSMNNGLLVGQTASGQINAGYNSYGLNGGPVYVVLRWNDTYTIDSTRVMWWYDGSGVTLPAAGTGTITDTSTNRTSIQYWNATNERWQNVTNMKDAAGTNTSNIGVDGGGTNNTNRIWNGVTFDPVITDRVRLVIQKGSGNGVGVGEWEVFGIADPAISDLNAINANMFQNIIANINLPSTGLNGSVITWSNSTNSALTIGGVATRPSVGLPNATGTITATAVHPKSTATKTFNFTVLAEMPNAQTPNITAQPASSIAINISNPSATLSVAANVTDGGTLSYQWYKNTSASSTGGTEIAGATDSTYEVPVNESGTFYYYVVVKNTNVYADNQIAMATSSVSTVTVTGAVSKIEINPVNNLNPIRFTVEGGPGNAKLRDYFRVNTENTFLRPGESVTYNTIITSVGTNPNPVWSITGGVGTTAISSDGKLTVDPTQPAGDIIVTARVNDVSASAKVTVRIVTDAQGYDQRAKWTVEPFTLSDVSLDGDNVWTKNRSITLRYLGQGVREEMELKQFYMTAGITTLPIAINGKAAGSNVSALTDAAGWDGRGYATNRLMHRALSGHGTGHYLSAISQAYQVAPEDTQKATFLSKMKLMVQELGRIQDTNIEKGSYMYGFLSAYNEKQFDALEEDKNRTPTTTEDNGRGAWAIYYTQHKIIQGLLDIYTTLKGTEDDATAQRALEIASKMGDWTYLRLSRWTQADRELMWNVYSAGEIGGIGAPIEQLYFITGDELYRETATFFEQNNTWNSTGSVGNTNSDGYTTRAGTVTATTRSGDAFFPHFAQGLDGYWLNSKHANTIVPMIIASLREYEADTTVDTPEDLVRINPVGYTPKSSHYYDIAKNFFDAFYTTRMSPIGGTAHGEIFQNFGNPVTPSWSSVLGTGAGNSNESCTTVNLMLLATSLFKHEQRAVYMDYYERALVNHIMPTLAQNSSATQNRIDYLFYMGTNSVRSHDRYGDGACCNGTGWEAHARYQDTVYYKTTDGTGLYVNLYIPSTLNWPEKDFQIVQENDYLNEGSSKLTVNGNGPLDIKLRVPYWVEKGFVVKVNGEVVVKNAARSSYVTVSRNWTSGDVIEISMPFSARIERSPENTTNTTVALYYGPYMMVQQPGVAARPTISGLNMADINSSFTKTTGPSRTHSFGNYTAFRLTYNNQNYDPMYTATTNNTNYCANFTVPRNNDNVTVKRSVVGENGVVSTNSNNRTVTDGQSINRGSIVTFTATPDPGYKVKRWKLNGVTVGGNRSNNYTLTGINSDADVTVEFAPIEGTEFSVSLDELQPGALLNAMTTIGETEKTSKVYLAVYDANGVLIDVDVSAEFSADPELGKEKIVTSLVLPDDITGVSVKAFIWDADFRPISPVTILD